MRKLYETIFGLISSLLIFSSPAESKKISGGSPDYHIPDVPKITNLDQIDLVPNPPPLVLRQADLNADDMFAAHRSHSSHRSHASHRSGSTSPSRIPETTTPVTPSETEKVPTPVPVVPQRSPSTAPPDSSVKEWKTSAEWVSQPCRLSYHEVIIYFHDDTRLEGMVSGCQDNSIQITKRASGTGEAKQWINTKDIKALLWR